MVTEIRGALDAYPREQLQEILAWVFKEYVVEGGAAPAQGALAMLDARSELEGLSFAELVTWLQLHLDVPELAALEVQGARVSLRAGGRTIPIEVAARAPEPPVRRAGSGERCRQRRRRSRRRSARGQSARADAACRCRGAARRSSAGSDARAVGGSARGHGQARRKSRRQEG